MKALKPLPMNCGPLSEMILGLDAGKFSRPRCRVISTSCFKFLAGGILASGEGGGSVFEEGLLPGVEDVGVQVQLVTQVGDGHLVQQVAAQGGDLFVGGEMAALFWHRTFSPVRYIVTEIGEKSNSG